MKRLENEVLIDLLHRYGTATSIALLDPVCHHFFLPDISGVIGYRIESNCIVAFGDPVCAPDDAQSLIQAFHEHCHAQKKALVYVGVSETFVDGIVPQNNFSAIGLGQEIIIDPTTDLLATTGSNARLLRKKNNHATKAGITICEYTDHNPELEQAMEAVKNAWLENRTGPQIYLSQVNTFADRANKRWFYAECNGTVVGVLMVNRAGAKKGWVFNVLMLIPDAPNGTSESLLLFFFQTLRQEGCTFFSTGTNPALSIGRMEGFGKVSQWALRKAYALAQKVFRLHTRQKFWEKFNPRLEASFLVFNRSRLRVSHIISLLKALNVKMRNKKEVASSAQEV